MQTAWIIAITVVVWLLALVAFSYLLNVAGQVYRGALYLYAIEGAAPGPFDAEQMNAAWKTKPGGKLGWNKTTAKIAIQEDRRLLVCTGQFACAGAGERSSGIRPVGRSAPG